MPRAKWFRWSALVIAILALLALLPFLIPSGVLAPKVEAIATEKLGVPVRVGSLRVHLLPLPHLTASDIVVGKSDVAVAEVAIYPALMSLFSGTPVLRLVEVRGLSFKDGVFALLKPPKAADGPPPVAVRRIVVRDLKPEIKGQAMGAWDVEFELAENQRVERAELKSTDGKLTAHLTPLKDRWALEVNARDWRPPAGPALLFTSLEATGTVTDRQIDLPQVRARLYEGELQGSVRADYAPAWQLTGNFQANGVDIGPLVKVLMPKQAIGGRLTADGRLSGRAPKPEGLADALTVAGKFNVSNGVLYGIDLASAASRLVGGSSKGDTRFDELRGDYVVQGKNVRLRQLMISSGVMEAKGNVDIAGGSKLGGTMDVNLRNTGGMVGVPLAFSGTVASPTVTPTKGATIGAAVGTVLLPGVGTSIGASIGRFFEKKTED